MSEADYAGLITAAHRQLAAPVILIWDYVPVWQASELILTFTAIRKHRVACTTSIGECVADVPWPAGPWTKTFALNQNEPCSDACEWGML